MKIEKINETQIKFVLSQSDLDERNIKLNELAYGSDKTHQLFQEMMRQASLECDFNAENTPLMVEAMPIGGDSVVVVVTKITDVTEIEQTLNLIPKAKESARFKRKGLIAPPKEAEEDGFVSIFSFDTLDDAAEAAAHLNGRIEGESLLYKYTNRYFLVLQTDDKRDASGYTEALLSEYGQKHISNPVSAQYLFERGEMLVPKAAVEKLAAYTLIT